MSTQFYINNEIENAAAVVSSENAQFPLTNLNDARRSKVFRSTSNTTSITFDFGYPVLIDTIMMVGDPMTGNSLTACHVLIDNASDFSSALEADMTIDNEHSFSYVNINTTMPVRYMRLEMTSVAGFCEVAKLFAGAKVELEETLDFSLPLNFKIMSKASISVNGLGQKFIDEKGSQKRISGSIKAMNKTELDGFLSIADYAGNTKPIWVKFDSILNNPNRLSGYYYLAGNTEPTLDSSLYWSLPIELEEAL